MELHFRHHSRQYNVYIRKGRSANPLLFDLIFTNVGSHLNLSGSFSPGDLVGIHIDFQNKLCEGIVQIIKCTIHMISDFFRFFLG